MPDSEKFRIGLSADFLDADRQLVFPDLGLSLLDNDPRVSYEFIDEYKPEYAPGQLTAYDAVISLKPRVTAAALVGAEKLTAIGRCGVGYDNVDLAACTAADVAVFITPSAVRRPMAESIVLFILALSHNLVWKDHLIRQGEWTQSTRRLGTEPRDRVVGSIGLGNIASEVVRLLRPFDVGSFLAVDPCVDPSRGTELGVDLVSLEEVLRRSDYVLVNCPLTEETRHMVGERELQMMKPDSVLINTARGPIVDEGALVKALQDGVIRAAALDVFEKEPLDPDSPLVGLENVVLTSHSVGWTEELFRDMGRADCEGALAVSRGEIPVNVVNPEVLERPGFLRKIERHRKAR